MFGIILLLFFVPYAFLTNDVIEIPLQINGEKLVLGNLSTKILLFFCAISFCFFIYGIYQLRKVLSFFDKKIIFEQDVIKLLNQVGKNFILASLFSAVPLFIYHVFCKTTADLSFGGGFSSFLFTLSLGLFFMVLSEVFKIAKTMKEENELTV